MLYVNPDISGLPSLRETIDIIENLTRQFPIVHLDPFTPSLDDDVEFVLTRTDLRYSIKPNITRQGVLYGWHNEFDANYPQPIKASIFDIHKPNFLLNNLLREDAEIIYESHPLYALLKYGIELPQLRRKIQIHNPYGLSHAYGLKSHFISLTSSLEIAAFHASHHYNREGQCFEPITDISKAGVIFIFELGAPFSMIFNLSTVGKHAFERPGLNKLFVYHCNQDTNFGALPFVKGFQFKHCAEDTAFYSQAFNNGEQLYPQDLLSNKINVLLSQKEFSKTAFKRNLRCNPQDKEIVNRQKLNEAGYTMVQSRGLEYTRDELIRNWFDNIETNWSNFWTNVAFPMLSPKQLQRLLELPDDANYRQYFDLNSWINRPR